MSDTGDFGDVDLEAMKSARSTTPDDERTRCEECGSPNLRPKGYGSATARTVDSEYVCDNCGEHVDGTGGKHV